MTVAAPFYTSFEDYLVAEASSEIKARLDVTTDGVLYYGNCRVVGDRFEPAEHIQWGSSTDGWSALIGGEPQTFVRRFNGAKWFELPDLGSPILGIWGSSPTDVWVVGEDGLIVHFAP